MRMPGCLRRAAALAGAGAGVGGIVLAGSVTLATAPAAAAAGAGAAARSPAPTAQSVRHPNVSRTHSPKLLRQLAGGSGSSTPGQLTPAASAATVAGALHGVDVASFQEQKPDQLGAGGQRRASSSRRSRRPRATITRTSTPSMI